MPKNENCVRKRPLRMHGSNHVACLLCYLIAFAVPVAWEYAALRLIYPWKLAFTAPDLAAHVANAFPALGGWLSPVAATASDGAFSLREMLIAREKVWLNALAISAGIAWGMTLLVQLLWRCTHRSPLCSARRTAGAIRSCRLALLIICLINAAMAAGMWLLGLCHVTGRTLWDYLVCFGMYALNPLAAAVVSRLAAPPAISGRHAYFKRI